MCQKACCEHLSRLTRCLLVAGLVLHEMDLWVLLFLVVASPQPHDQGQGFAFQGDAVRI